LHCCEWPSFSMCIGCKSGVQFYFVGFEYFLLFIYGCPFVTWCFFCQIHQCYFTFFIASVMHVQWFTITVTCYYHATYCCSLLFFAVLYWWLNRITMICCSEILTVSCIALICKQKTFQVIRFLKVVWHRDLTCSYSVQWRLSRISRIAVSDRHLGCALVLRGGGGVRFYFVGF